MLTNRLDFPQLKVLDLYSGTGAIAIEFISRGAKSATAVDINRVSVKFMAEVKSDWEIENFDIVKSNAVKYLQRNQVKFDLIFADPPYQSEDAFLILKTVQSQQALNEHGLLVIEHDKRKSFVEEPSFQEMRAFGKVNFSFFGVL